MIYTLKTSALTETIFKTIGASTGLQPFALSKLAIALSIHSGRPLTDEDFRGDNNGLELNRQTITGNYDLLLTSLIANFENMQLKANDLFPRYFKAHIDRGAILLEREYKYDRNFYQHLCNLEKGI